MSKNGKRIFELDALRGISVIAMIIDHSFLLFWMMATVGGIGSYIFSNFYSVNHELVRKILHFVNAFEESFFRNACHYIFVTIFLLICGISSSLSRSNFKRGLIIIGAGFIVTIASAIISDIAGGDYYIIFGILSTIGVSIIIYEVITRIFNNEWFLLIIGLSIILWGFLIEWWDVPRLYSIKDLNFVNLIKVILGYTLYGEDCFGLIPCTGVVLVGGYLGKTYYAKRESLIPKWDKPIFKPFNFVGRHALWFYLLHQVVAFILIVILFLILGYRF